MKKKETRIWLAVVIVFVCIGFYGLDRTSILIWIYTALLVAVGQKWTLHLRDEQRREEDMLSEISSLEKQLKRANERLEEYENKDPGE